MLFKLQNQKMVLVVHVKHLNVGFASISSKRIAILKGVREIINFNEYGGYLIFVGKNNVELNEHA